ncbi:DNA polymerase III subunit epsilon [Candidatus Berkiella aquae]|uniref:DNA polymerase III subunit epsilon n=1 Tax=Candidatus Berkiella aquae TaxID=295108 RepID=A0A0Q9YIB7_9GAMM|nr:DNA polymerase III subunit epsilon [Candidatus Berkiella aquae]MCS5711705.1 DNA polymerase III subunit epsilon [Candidatus Berkiella aquae]
MRQVVLDTETTGLSPAQGHRIIEIGCVEVINRRLTGKVFHTYIQPDRAVDPGAMKVHGITDSFLEGKPRFHEIANEFKTFIQGAELIIHNAPFDVGFIEHEFTLLKEKAWQTLTNQCSVFDTLAFARQKHPGQRNNLDALCKRYNVDNQHRDKHGALLDADILANLYLVMTGGQNALVLEDAVSEQAASVQQVEARVIKQWNIPVIEPTEDELNAHLSFMSKVLKQDAF